MSKFFTRSLLRAFSAHLHVTDLHSFSGDDAPILEMSPYMALGSLMTFLLGMISFPGTYIEFFSQHMSAFSTRSSLWSFSAHSHDSDLYPINSNDIPKVIMWLQPPRSQMRVMTPEPKALPSPLNLHLAPTSTKCPPNRLSPKQARVSPPLPRLSHVMGEQSRLQLEPGMAVRFAFSHALAY